jgi:hypothetical protein
MRIFAAVAMFFLIFGCKKTVEGDAQVEGFGAGTIRDYRDVISIPDAIDRAEKYVLANPPRMEAKYQGHLNIETIKFYKGDRYVITIQTTVGDSPACITKVVVDKTREKVPLQANYDNGCNNRVKNWGARISFRDALTKATTFAFDKIFPGINDDGTVVRVTNTWEEEDNSGYSFTFTKKGDPGQSNGCMALLAISSDPAASPTISNRQTACH